MNTVVRDLLEVVTDCLSVAAQRHCCDRLGLQGSPSSGPAGRPVDEVRALRCIRPLGLHRRSGWGRWSGSTTSSLMGLLRASPALRDRRGGLSPGAKQPSTPRAACMPCSATSNARQLRRRTQAALRSTCRADAAAPAPPPQRRRRAAARRPGPQDAAHPSVHDLRSAQGPWARGVFLGPAVTWRWCVACGRCGRSAGRFSAWAALLRHPRRRAAS